MATYTNAEQEAARADRVEAEVTHLREQLTPLRSGN